ncbi:MAG: amidohydrolase, partial [Pseudonocardia sp.]
MSRADSQLAGLNTQARSLQPRTIALRRALHRHPELGLDLPRTRDAVVAALADLPLQIHLGRSSSSVVAVLD